MDLIVLLNQKDQIKQFDIVHPVIFVHDDRITRLAQEITFAHHQAVVENCERMNITLYTGILGNIFQKRNLTT